MERFYNLKKYSAHTALIAENDRKISYGELHQSSQALIEKLDSECLAFLLCENSLGSVISYLSCLEKKTVVFLLPAEVDIGLLKHLIETYKPKFLLSPRTRQDCDKFGTVDFQVENYELRRLSSLISYPIHPDLAVLMTTSGSTGSPKLVKVSRDNLQANAQSIVEYLKISGSDRGITTMPMNYAYGLSIINSHLCVGASVVLNDYSMLDKKFWTSIKTNSVTSFGGVPYSYKILKRLNFDKMDLPSIRYITQAGGKLDLDLTKWYVDTCRKMGIEFITMYGQTEATARMSYLSFADAIQKIGSIGSAIPGGSFSIVNEIGEELTEPEATGELVYRGPNVCMGYAETYLDLSLGNVWNGYLRTGDLARRSPDGFYYIVGRIKRFAKIFGNRVNLDEVEAIAAKQGWECVCVGSDDLLRVFTTSSAETSKIREGLSLITGLHPSAFKITFIKEVPRNSVGKILYGALEGTDEH